MTSPRVFLAGPPGSGKTVVLQLKATEWLRRGSDVFLVCTSDSCAATYRMYYLLQQTIETQLAPTVTPGQLHLLEYTFRTNSDVKNAVNDLSQAATGGTLHVIADEMDSLFSSNFQMFRDKLLTQVPHLHFWAASYYPKPVLSNWQVQYLTRPIRFPETVEIELARKWTVTRHDLKTYSLRGEYESSSGPPVQRFPLPRHKDSHRRTRRIDRRCVTCGEHVAKILLQVLAGVPGNITTTSTAIAYPRSDTTSPRLQYRDVLILPSIHVRYFMDLETGLRKAGIPVRYMSNDNLEDIVTAREDEVVVADEDDVRGLERKVVIVIVDEFEDAELLAISRCTSQLVYITHRDSKHLLRVPTRETQHDRLNEDVSDHEFLMPPALPVQTSYPAFHKGSSTTDKWNDSVIRKFDKRNQQDEKKKEDKTSDNVSTESTEEKQRDIKKDVKESQERHENSNEVCTESTEKKQWDKKKGDKETQKTMKRDDEALVESRKKKAEEMEIQTMTSLAAGNETYLLKYKIAVDLRKTATVRTSQLNLDSLPNNHDNTEYNTREATEKCEDMVPSPIFSERWQNCIYLSAEGSTLRRQGSDVVLQVLAGTIEDNTKVKVYSAICVNDVYIKHKLQLPETETIVSPLAEFWAGPDFRFQNKVQITLPTCLPFDFDINLLHVYCITNEKPEGKMIFSKLARLDQTTNNEKSAVYFYVNEGQVKVMTTHFSGYVCTYCGLCLNIGLEVFESHKQENGAVHVSIVAQFWDKLHVKDFKETLPEPSSYTKVLSSTFQLTKVLTPAQLQVDLIIDDEQTNLWQFKETRAPTKTFCLNWRKIKCKNSMDKEHQAMKYTYLGPFSPGWKVKSKQNENEMMPSTLDAYLLVSHLTEKSSEPLWTSAQYHIDVQGPPDVKECVHTNVTINQYIKKVENINIAEQSEIQRSDQENGTMKHISAENEDSEQHTCSLKQLC